MSKDLKGIFDGHLAALDAVGYWFEKLEGKKPYDDAEINRYSAARHGIGTSEAMALTIPELAEFLPSD